jgi:hypothetical protein
MTPAQKKALRPYREKLQQTFAEAAATATTPGQARTWFVPYLVAVLKVYQELTTQTVDGRALSRALAKNPRDAFFKLLKTSKRDSKTRSRWAAALANGYASGVSPKDLPRWLKKGGGAAGRAGELSKSTQRLKQAANQPTPGTATPSPQPRSSPQTNSLSPQPTEKLK